MTIWIDAQLSPSLALWINDNFDGITAQSVRAVGLRDAKDIEIFMLARNANVIMMTKDDDFGRLQEKHGPPPPVIWVTCGNTSNADMREVLRRHLSLAIELIKGGECLVEIR